MWPVAGISSVESTLSHTLHFVTFSPAVVHVAFFVISVTAVCFPVAGIFTSSTSLHTLHVLLFNPSFEHVASVTTSYSPNLWPVDLTVFVSIKSPHFLHMTSVTPSFVHVTASFTTSSVSACLHNTRTEPYTELTERYSPAKLEGAKSVIFNTEVPIAAPSLILNSAVYNSPFFVLSFVNATA